MSTLVFLEHHDGELQKGSLGVLSKAASLGGDVAGVVVGSGLDGFAAQAGRHGAATVYVADDAQLEAPLPQPRVDAIAQLVEEQGIETVLFGQSILAADIAAGLAARLEAGLNWQLTDLVEEGGALVGKRSALGDSVSSTWAGRRRRASGSSAPARSTRPSRRRRATVEDLRAGAARASRSQRRWSSRRTPRRAARRSRMRT